MVLRDDSRGGVPHRQDQRGVGTVQFETDGVLIINDYLLDQAEPGDKVIFFGGDDFFRMADEFLAEAARREGSTDSGPENVRVGGPLDSEAQ